MKIKANKIQVSQKLNENVFIEVDDAEDFVPEIKIEFVNADLILNKEEKLEVGKIVLNYIMENL